MHQQVANGCETRAWHDPRRRGPNRLDARRRRLLKGISQGMTIAEAGAQAGYVHRQAAHRAFKSIQLWLPQALEGAGYPVDKMLTELVEKLRDQMEAKKTRFFKYKGVVTDVREVPAHNIQLRAITELFKLLGLYPGKEDASAYPECAMIPINVIVAGPANSAGSDISNANSK